MTFFFYTSKQQQFVNIVQANDRLRLGPWLQMPILYQVVLEHVYLGVLLRVVGSAGLVVDDRGGTVVLVFGGVRVEDVHGALLLGLRRLCRLLDLLLRLVLQEESVGQRSRTGGSAGSTTETLDS